LGADEVGNRTVFAEGKGVAWDNAQSYNAERLHPIITRTRGRPPALSMPSMVTITPMKFS
jgi:hypothetical protein